MNNYIKQIENKVKNNLKIERLKITDNTSKHKTHKFFDKNKYHFYLEIDSKYLKSLKLLDAQRMVMKVLKEEMNTKIHALEIKIK
ncbi:BolA family transcriptional regulator [Pelagibacteraceae bacterium]|jgi:BolA protein|nr:BolA family transcriptional regulator [Pelagibacteraceae bacterium]|tara:strand:+ start:473 stop:727 length:255 start_codon:yes stop_codon:yes gene_type:complete